MTDVITIIKYEITGAGGTRTKPVFDYEFPKTIYVVLE